MSDFSNDPIIREILKDEVVKIAIQCTDAEGNLGDFGYLQTVKNRVTPMFPDLVPLYHWLRDNDFAYDEMQRGYVLKVS